MKHYTLLTAALLFAANLFAQTWTKHPVSATLPADSKILHFDPTGKVWVGGPGIWLSVWDGKKWSSETRPADLPVADKDLYVTAMGFDAKNNRILGTNKGLIYQNYVIPATLNRPIANLANTKKQIFLLDDEGVSINQYGTTLSQLALPPSCPPVTKKNAPNPLLWDPKRSRLWAGSMSINIEDEMWVHFENMNNTRDITLIPNNDIAFVSQTGELCFFNKKMDSIFSYSVLYKEKTPIALKAAKAAPNGSWWFTTYDAKAPFISVDTLTNKSLKLLSKVRSVTTVYFDPDINRDERPPVTDAPYDEIKSETPNNDPNKVYDTDDIQKLPLFPGGESAMKTYLSTNLIYPEAARKGNIQGTVAISCIVQKDGTLTDIKILKDAGGGCAAEAVRLVQNMPKWIPGEANGNPVAVKYTLPVRFRLQ